MKYLICVKTKNVVISIVLSRFLVVFSLRLADCILYAVGKPVYHKSTNVTYGSWLKDAHPRNKDFGEKIWTTYETHHTIIFEFADKISFRNNQAMELHLKSPGFQVWVLIDLMTVYWNKVNISSRIYKFFSFVGHAIGQCTRCIRRFILLSSERQHNDYSIWFGKTWNS